jgi:acyl-CoA synthetase (AMP-forming)/AMP-acid ligase II
MTTAAQVRGALGWWEAAVVLAGRAPDRILAIDEGGRELSFGGYVASAERLSGVLAARGVGAGSVVSWVLPTTIDAAVLAGALARLGAVQNPILPVYGASEVRFIVDQARSSHLVVAPPPGRGTDHAAIAAELAAERSQLSVLVLDDQLLAEVPASIPPEAPAPRPDETRWIFYTSGTTGVPRGARHGDAGILASGRGMADRVNVTAADRNSMVFPITHIGGVAWLAVSFLTGMSNVFVSSFDAVETPRLLSGHGVTLVGGGSAFLLAYVHASRAGDEPLFATARVFLAGGAPKPDGLQAALVAAFGDVPLVSGYGMTEAPLVAFSSVADPLQQRSITEGTASGGAVMRAVRPDGTACAAGEVGELQIKGPQVMLGYVDPAGDAAVFDPEGWLRSGDLGFLDADGYVVVTGRLKDVIIRKGENISAKEIEDLLFEHPKIADVAVIGLPDPVTGERCCAVCTLASGADALELSEVVEFLLARQIMKQKLPERLEVLDVLPRNATGKVLKHELRALLSR